MLLFSMPEEGSPIDYAHWIEDRLVARDFYQLLTELCAFLPSMEVPQTDCDEEQVLPGQPLAQVLGDQVEEVLQTGLGALVRNGEMKALRSLYKSPHALEELHSLIYMAGGEYWKQRIKAAGMTPPAKIEVCDPVRPLGSSELVTADTPIRSSRRTWLWAACTLATAAVVLLVLTMQSFQPSGWGWQKESLFASNLPAPQYLDSLASAADEWFKKKPANAEELKQRLIEYRQGCDVLQKARHAQLAATDREWLLERCRTWATKIDDHIAALSTTDFKDVQQAADETVSKLIKAIRDRSQALAV